MITPSRVDDSVAARQAANQDGGLSSEDQSVAPEAVVARIVAEHRSGARYSAIARALNDDLVPTTYGGRACTRARFVTSC